MEIKGKNVFVTGSTRGIGQAIALAFAKEGANIVLNGRGTITQEQLDAITEFGVQCIGVSGDISSFEDAAVMIKEAEEKLGSIHVLVNNAGITNDKLVMRMNGQDFEDVIKVNLTGTFNMTQHVLKKMLKQREGAIINLSSVSGLIGNLGQANYAASKAGIVGLTKSVAREAAARGVTCNAIAPGFISTDMTNVLSDKIKEQTAAQIPLGSFGSPENVAETAVFLAKNTYITGQVINVDGGLVMNG